MHLFLVHDARFFHERLAPTATASFRTRSFAPLRALADEYAPKFADTARRFHLTAGEQPLIANCESIPFTWRNWRHLAGEFLLYAADETPSFPTAPELLGRFLPTELVERLHRGSRELTFDGVPYRPDHAGLHDTADLSELAAELAAIDPVTWRAESLRALLADDRAEELEFAWQCFGNLGAMIDSARASGQVIVCEA